MVGIDILEISRMVGKEELANRVLTAEEKLYWASKNNSTETLAGLFCGKEAVLKALGSGIGNGCALSDINISHNELGQPTVVVGNQCQSLLQQLGASTIYLSISHTSTTAVAVAILR